MKQEAHMRAFCEVVGGFTLFPYQTKFLSDCLNSNRVIGIFGRQMGKTTTISLFSIYYALQKDNYTILVIAPTDRQAGELFSRLRDFAEKSGLCNAFIKNSTQREIDRRCAAVYQTAFAKR